MNFFSSVRYAIDGFFAALKHEPSFREDLIFAVLLVPLAIWLPVNAVSTALMIASLILILIVELLNSAIEWIIERYQISVDKDSGIKNDPNDWAKEHNQPRYILDLVKRVVRVSLETMKIVNGLPALEIMETADKAGSGASEEPA